MKKLLLIVFLGFFYCHTYAQVNFEKAYFIDNENVRTDCFIKNKGLYENPTTFEYKLTQGESVVNMGDIKNIKEFEISNTIKFVRNFVKIDVSTADLGQTKDVREPEWEEKTLFLKVLIEGNASLYEYKDKTVKRFFYKTDNLPLTQLIYKRYYLPNTNYIDLGVNNDFQRQIWQEMNCENQTLDTVLKLEYERKDLVNYFIKYNNCKKNSYIDYNKNISKGSFNIKIKGGVNVSPYNDYEDAQRKVDYSGNELFLKYGGEFEYITPFNRNKWAFFIELTYQTYKYSEVRTDKSTFGPAFDITTEASYLKKSFFPFLGIRYYMFLKDNSKLFVNAGFFQTFGLGYNYNDKFNVETRYSRIGLSEYSVVFGYTLFNNKK